MFRKSVLIGLISTAALGLVLDQASARGAMGTVSGARAANVTVARVSLTMPSHGFHLPRDTGFGPGYARNPGAALKIPAKVYQPYGSNPAAAAKIKPNYGSTLKPLPVPPIAAATNHPGTGVVTPPASNTAPGTPVTPPMHWPHKPGFYGTPAVGAGAVIVAAPALEAAPAATVVGTPIVTAARPAGAAPVAATTSPCTCLTKQYTPEGAVVFMDRCTNEVAVTAPQQTGAVAPSQLPQQVRPAN